MRKKIQRLFLAATTLVLFASILIAQENSKPRLWIPEKPENSETNYSYLQHLLTSIQKEPNPNGVIILIARLGKDETRRELNRRRLYNVSFLYKVTFGIPAEKIVVAQGEKVDGYGRVEIYWNGEMIGALPVFKNKDIYVDCCGFDYRYYPEKDAIERRQKQRTKRQRRG